MLPDGRRRVKIKKLLFVCLTDFNWYFKKIHEVWLLFKTHISYIIQHLFCSWFWNCIPRFKIIFILFFTTAIWKQCLQFNCKISTKAVSSLCTVDCYSFVLTSNHVSFLRYSGFSIFIQHVANILKVIRYGAHVLISIQQLTILTCSQKKE